MSSTQTEASLLEAEQFLTKKYYFRRNVLNGKVEYAKQPGEVADASTETDGDGERASDCQQEPLQWEVLTQEALNSIILQAKREDVCEKGNPKEDIIQYVNSNEVPMFNPIQVYLSSLPAWDGQNHVAQLFSRIPGVTSEQLGIMSNWLRSTVAHWLQMDLLHGNECVLTLIGDQGCGKTTFLRRLLPMELHQYFLDHLNLSNKFDREMALIYNLLVNIDEMDSIKPSQQAGLKQLLSKSMVNGRPIYGASQQDRRRYASFVATTNNPHPLTDTTGSRRFICVAIPHGQFIDNSGDIDYEQLFAQVVYELQVLHAPYWFNNEEVARIQELNKEFMNQKDLAAMVKVCFRQPKEGEKVKTMSTDQVLAIIQASFPTLNVTRNTSAELGRIMKELNFERRKHSNLAYYLAVPRKTA